MINIQIQKGSERGSQSTQVIFTGRYRSPSPRPPKYITLEILKNTLNDILDSFEPNTEYDKKIIDEINESLNKHKK